MAWIESHQTIGAHPKTRKAARALGIRPVHLVGHLHLLWHWALELAEDGDLSKFDAEDIAIAADWDGDPDQFVEALVDCGPGDSAGFLERDGQCGAPEDDRIGRLVLHDWWTYAGKLVERRRQDRDRKAAKRAEQQARAAAGRRTDDRSKTPDNTDSPDDVQQTSAGHPSDSPADSRSREPDPTRPDPTEPTPLHTRAPEPAPEPVENGQHEGGGPPVDQDQTQGETYAARALAKLPARITRQLEAEGPRSLGRLRNALHDAYLAGIPPGPIRDSLNAAPPLDQGADSITAVAIARIRRLIDQQRQEVSA